MRSIWVRIWGIVAASLAALLAACGDGPASNVSYKLGPQVWDFFIYAVSDGPVLVVVDGNPFQADAGAVGDGIATAMRAAFSEPFIAFTADPALSPHPDYRMIWTLNPAPGYNMDQACSAARPVTVPVTGRRFELRAAFCQGGRLLSAVHGWMPAANASLDDRRFRSLVSQMARQLLSTEGT